MLVSGAIPGERVAAADRARRAAARLRRATDVLDAVTRPARGGGRSAVRRLPLRHIAIERQRAIKAEIVADAFARIGRHRLSAGSRWRRRPIAATACGRDCTCATAASGSFAKARTSCVTRPAPDS